MARFINVLIFIDSFQILSVCQNILNGLLVYILECHRSLDLLVMMESTSFVRTSDWPIGLEFISSVATVLEDYDSQVASRFISYTKTTASP